MNITFEYFNTFSTHHNLLHPKKLKISRSTLSTIMFFAWKHLFQLQFYAQKPDERRIFFHFTISMSERHRTIHSLQKKQQKNNRKKYIFPGSEHSLFVHEPGKFKNLFCWKQFKLCCLSFIETCIMWGRQKKTQIINLI